MRLGRDREIRKKLKAVVANTKGWINVAPFTSDTEFDPEKSQSAKV